MMAIIITIGLPHSPIDRLLDRVPVEQWPAFLRRRTADGGVNGASTLDKFALLNRSDSKFHKLPNRFKFCQTNNNK